MTYAAVKDPNADLDFSFDWSAWLGDDTVGTSAWSARGVTLHDASIDASGRITTVFVAGGAPNQSATVTNRITTTSNPHRVDERTISIQIVQR